MSAAPELTEEDPRVAVLDRLEAALDEACERLGPELVQMLADERIASSVFPIAPERPRLSLVGKLH